MLKRMAAIIFGVTAVAMLSALASSDSGDAISRQTTPAAVIKSSAPVERGLLCTATVQQSQPAEVPENPSRESISPFALAKSINDVRRKRVDVDLKDTWQKLGIEAGSFETCSNDCEVRLYRHELSSNSGPEVVLKLMGSFESARFLVFGRAVDGLGWKFLGHVDHDFNRYEMARHRIASANGRPFLVIRGQEGSGSGFALYGETWYEVSDTGVKPVLTYPSDGHTYPWPAGLARTFKASQIPEAGRTGRATIQYTVTYDTDGYEGDEVKLQFVNRHRASYLWDAQSQKFILDAKQSNISEAEINAIANLQSDDQPKAGTKIGETTFYSSSEAKAFIGGGYEVFLKHNVDRLMRIAKGPASKSRTWLKRFLTECADTEEKKALHAALERS